MAKKPAVQLRKPQAAEAFVSGRPNAQTSKRSGAQKSVIARADGRELRRLTVYLPVDLARRLALACAESETAQSDAIAEAVKRWLS